MKGPLAGVRVIDVTSTFMGPYATLLLAQMGADVIKIEAPSGDVVRGIGQGRSAGMGPIFLNANAGKRSVVLDLKTPPGRRAITALAASADVFVHNMRGNAAAKLGIDAATLTDHCPALVHCTFRGFDDGPYAEQPAYDDVIQGISGMAAVQGSDGPPVYVATPMADKTVGLAGGMAIVAALFRRERTGVGEAVSVPMFEVMASFLLLEQQGGRVYDPPLGSSGYGRTSSVYRRPYATRNGYLSVLIYTDLQWERFFRIAGLDDLIGDARFDGIQARTEHIDDLYAIVADVLTTRTADDWIDEFQRSAIPAMPVNTIDDLIDDPHLAANGFFKQVDHPTEGRLLQPRLPLRFEQGASDTGPAPSLGEHTAEVLDELGLEPDDLAAIVASAGPTHEADDHGWGNAIP